MVTENVKVTE